MKVLKLSLFALLLLAPLQLSAQVLYEYFDRPSRSSILPREWIAMHGHSSVCPVRTDWDNRSLIFGGCESKWLSGWLRPVPELELGRVGTYYYEFSLEDTELNHHIGVSLTRPQRFKILSHFTAHVVLRESATGDGVDLLVSEPGGKVTTVVTGLQPAYERYYGLWMVVDMKNFCFDIYLKEAGSGEADREDLLAEKVRFNKPVDRPICTFAMLTRWSGEDVRGLLRMRNFAYAKGVSLGSVDYHGSLANLR
ncbi:hypothetical protein [Persicirhabdus sediminis]|uniref:DUF4105 domain-containing protein n=1 Tax=Persicirhabdus sediminis TaxID=454144 RepID=A0A8J7SI80_9BACT|nr:hypothetical protein [Persicirhabdus sediminis]MBK1790379.1 hypothetical protein [Persicirhabdus sediminis]